MVAKWAKILSAVAEVLIGLLSVLAMIDPTVLMIISVVDVYKRQIIG